MNAAAKQKRSGFISILLLKRLIWGRSFTYKTIKTQSRRAARIGNLFEPIRN